MKAQTTKYGEDRAAYIHFIFEEQGEIVEFSCRFPRGRTEALTRRGMSEAASKALARFQRMIGNSGLINEAAPNQKALVEKINAGK